MTTAIKTRGRGKAKPTFTVFEAAERLGSPLTYVYMLVQQGKLKARKVGRVWRVEVEAVGKRVEAQRIKREMKKWEALKREEKAGHLRELKEESPARLRELEEAMRRIVERGHEELLETANRQAQQMNRATHRKPDDDEEKKS